MDVVSLTLADCRLLAARCREHGNSYLRMTAALKEAKAGETLERLRALRRIERRFAVDLGQLCCRLERRDEPGTHPIERWMLGYVARWEGSGHVDSKSREPRLWVLLDRLREVREWITEGPMVGEPEG